MKRLLCDTAVLMVMASFLNLMGTVSLNAGARHDDVYFQLFGGVSFILSFVLAGQTAYSFILELRERRG